MGYSIMRISRTILLTVGVLFCIAPPAHFAHEWKMWGSLNKARAFGYVVPISATSAIAIGGFPDFVPGSQEFGTWVTRSCEILDVKTGTVRYTDSTSVGHADGTVVRMSNGKVVVLGGVKDGKGKTTTVVEEFDPVTERWTKKGNLLLFRRQQVAIALDDHRILIAAGRDTALEGTTATEIFDLRTGICTRGGEHPHPLTNHRLMMADSNVYLIGGRKSGPGGPDTDRPTDTYYYDEATDAWKFAFNLPGGKPLFESIHVYNGIYTSGGSTDNGDTRFSDIVYFIGKDGARALAGRLQTSVKGHCFAQWVGDSLITFGGESGTASSNASSWINTLTGSVHDGPDLNIGRRYGSSVFLNGDAETPAAVLALAGVMSNDQVTPTIEIITSTLCAGTTVSSLLDPRQLTTVGTAEMTATPSVMLTSSTPYSAGAVWWKNKVSLRSGVSTSFSFRMRNGSDNGQPDGGSPGADGFALVIQNSSPSPLGAAGQGIGYEDIPNAVVVEFDAYLNAAYSDPSGSHVAVQSQRDKKVKPWHRDGHLAGVSTNVPMLRSDGTVYYAKVDFHGTGVDVFLDTVPSFSGPVLTIPSVTLTNMISLGLDISAWIGITSATGFSAQEHELLSWSIEGCDALRVGVEESNENVDSDLPVIYPMPTRDVAMVRWVSAATSSVVKVYDATGQKIWSQSVSGADLRSGIQLPSSLSSGIYFVQIVSPMSVLSIPWLVQQ